MTVSRSPTLPWIWIVGIMSVQIEFLQLLGHDDDTVFGLVVLDLVDLVVCHQSPGSIDITHQVNRNTPQKLIKLLRRRTLILLK